MSGDTRRPVHHILLLLLLISLLTCNAQPNIPFEDGSWGSFTLSKQVYQYKYVVGSSQQLSIEVVEYGTTSAANVNITLSPYNSNTTVILSTVSQSNGNTYYRFEPSMLPQGQSMVLTMSYAAPTNSSSLALYVSYTRQAADNSVETDEVPPGWLIVVIIVGGLLLLNLLVCLIVFFKSQKKKPNPAVPAELNKRRCRAWTGLILAIAIFLAGFAVCILGLIVVPKKTDNMRCCSYYMRSQATDVEPDKCTSDPDVALNCFFSQSYNYTVVRYILGIVIGMCCGGIALIWFGFWIMGLQMMKLYRLFKKVANMKTTVKFSVGVDMN